MSKKTVLAGVLAVATFAVSAVIGASVSSKAADGLSEAQVRLIVEDYIQKNPEKILKSVQDYSQNQERARQAADNASVGAVAGELLADKGLPITGNPNGKIEIAYFFDYNCGYCKQMHPVLQQIVKENADVKIVYHDFPILSESSVQAAKVALTLWKKAPGKFEALHNALEEHKGALDLAAITASLASVIPADEAAALVADAISGEAGKAADETIAANRALAQKVKVQGTPFIFLKDHPFRGAIDQATLQSAVTEVRKAK